MSYRPQHEDRPLGGYFVIEMDAGQIASIREFRRRRKAERMAGIS